jgi:hypothetical protein
LVKILNDANITILIIISITIGSNKYSIMTDFIAKIYQIKSAINSNKFSLKKNLENFVILTIFKLKWCKIIVG